MQDCLEMEIMTMPLILPAVDQEQAGIFQDCDVAFERHEALEGV